MRYLIVLFCLVALALPSMVMAEAGAGVSVDLTTVVVGGQSGGGSGFGGASGGASYISLESQSGFPNPPAPYHPDNSWNKAWTSTWPEQGDVTYITESNQPSEVPSPVTVSQQARSSNPFLVLALLGVVSIIGVLVYILWRGTRKAKPLAS